MRDNRIVIGLGAVVCAAVPPVTEMLFTQRQMANSILPLLIVLGAPFLVSLAVSAVQANSVKVTAAWIAIAAIAFFAGDVYAIFHVRRGDNNLWPIELVISTGLATVALIAGAVLGRTWSKGEKKG